MALFPYSFQNHFRFGVAEPGESARWFAPRKSESELFVAGYGRASASLGSWREANELAAQKILDLARERGLVPVVCFGGGIDSEVVLTAFLKVLNWASRLKSRRSTSPTTSICTTPASSKKCASA